ncbi:hypothetical protein BCR42DRAFT_456361 [Absidia repens]|uniref:Uncharacterized protein n=1 Tax=Absidia repens TaxID=90262 RepID=A0A1X2I0U9_9FUNG|nr:hypothetical protein BCR42DRAFT_456361 [Absidia repens]
MTQPHFFPFILIVIMSFSSIQKSAYNVLDVHMKNQILRIEKLVDPGPSYSNKRKRPFNDITNTSVISLEPSVASTSSTSNAVMLENVAVLNEINDVLKHTHILKQWYLGILQQKGKEDSQEDYLFCKVLKKGVGDAEDHAIKMLNHIQEYHLKRLDLLPHSSSAQEKNDTLIIEQKTTTLKITDTIYHIKTTHMLKEILNIYAEFRDIALELYKSTN